MSVHCFVQEPVRVDARGLDELRHISAEAGPLSRTVHGSGLFTRGETQTLATATVGHDTEVAPVSAACMCACEMRWLERGVQVFIGAHA